MKVVKYAFSVKGELSLRNSNIFTSDRALPFQNVYIGMAYYLELFIVRTYCATNVLFWWIKSELERHIPWLL